MDKSGKIGSAVAVATGGACLWQVMSGNTNHALAITFGLLAIASAAYTVWVIFFGKDEPVAEKPPNIFAPTGNNTINTVNQSGGVNTLNIGAQIGATWRDIELRPAIPAEGQPGRFQHSMVVEIGGRPIAVQLVGRGPTIEDIELAPIGGGCTMTRDGKLPDGASVLVVQQPAGRYLLRVTTRSNFPDFRIEYAFQE